MTQIGRPVVIYTALTCSCQFKVVGVPGPGDRLYWLAPPQQCASACICYLVTYCRCSQTIVEHYSAQADPLPNTKTPVKQLVEVS